MPLECRPNRVHDACVGLACLFAEALSRRVVGLALLKALKDKCHVRELLCARNQLLAHLNQKFAKAMSLWSRESRADELLLIEADNRFLRESGLKARINH